MKLALGILVIASIGVGAYVVDDYWPQRVAASLPKADKVIVKKSERRLLLVKGETVLKEYLVSLGRNPVGPKQKEGDSKTPEGSYVIDWRNLNSKFFRSLHISYPSAVDTARAQAAGVSPGGNIMIHGLPNGLGLMGVGFVGRDWTDGCIAVDNVSMEEILASVPNGTPIEILP